MMQCKEAAKLMSVYVDGELDGSEARKFEQHINQCCCCKKEVHLMQEAKRMISNRYQCAIAPDHLRADILCAVKSHSEKRPWYSFLFAPFRLRPSRRLLTR